ncbi:unnamed protein product [Rotaria sp. Silwood2]|nr:unnamed protein product [Rotaria sp. Silwood2]CAF3026749.1 unnamed protein product [Rotaria sp. Silwood2]CAF3473348.1 unnamed protein product [Rotaria sp. Silwood2]CAF3945763.1 unnamed protein product [Rotaria sp. Silwood2]CAF4135378.1 unnamed protein product [Rotaria sp. Silwood2]
MSENCTKSADQCQYNDINDFHLINRFTCSLHGEYVQRHQILLHAYSNDDCTCQHFLNSRYTNDYDEYDQQFYYEHEQNSETNETESWD